MKKTFIFYLLFISATFLQAQNVGIGTTQPTARLHVSDSAVLFTGPSILFLNTPYNPPASGAGGRTMWYPAKGAFRTGVVSGTNWDKDSIGYYSFASGIDSKASGLFAIAMGRLATASNFSSVSIGEKNVASGAFAVSMGIVTKASGESSVTFGNNTVAKARGGFTSGIFNDTLDNPDNNVSNSTDRIFQLGNGTDMTRSNALTVLRNGNTGIGTANPGAGLHVDVDKTVLFGADTSGGGAKLIWFPSKSAFRAGLLLSGSNAWDYSNVGTGSFAVGTGNYAPAVGSSAIGSYNQVTGTSASAIGYSNVVSGDLATAVGIELVSRSFGETAMGWNNTDYIPASSNSWIGTDRLFGIGNGSTGAARSDAMVILKNGNIGLGTTLPVFPLDFRSVVGDKISLIGNPVTGTSIGFGVQPGLFQIHGEQISDDIAFGYGSSAVFTEQMRIKGNGNVGIGINPTEKLQVAGKIKTTTLQITNGANNGNVLTSDANGNASWEAPVNATNYWTANGANIYKNNTGNIGIGTSTPTTAKLVISGSATQEGLDLATTDQYANLRVIRNSLHSADKDMYIGFQSGAVSSLHLYSNNNETVTVKGNNVGIGNNSPSSKLQVDGAIRVQGSQTTHAQGLSLEWNNAGGGGGSGASYLLNQKGLGGGGFVLGEVDLANAITHRLDIDNNGNVGISNATPKSTLDITGSFATRVQYKTSSSGAISLDNTATIWIFSLNIGASIVLPNPSDCPNRRYTIANRNNVAMTISNYFNLSNSVASSIPAFSSVELVSGSGSWEQIK